MSMRKVEAYYYKEGTAYLVTGLFHQWAADMVEGSFDFGNFTVALVEDENGQIIKCLPETVRFLEPPMPF